MKQISIPVYYKNQADYSKLSLESFMDKAKTFMKRNSKKVEISEASQSRTCTRSIAYKNELDDKLVKYQDTISNIEKYLNSKYLDSTHSTIEYSKVKRSIKRKLQVWLDDLQSKQKSVVTLKNDLNDIIAKTNVFIK